MKKYKVAIKLLICLFLLSIVTNGQETAQWHTITRQIHYAPEGDSFVLKNGKRKFNRALYGTNSGFRVEAGDLPEFAMYMPGMGGNFKLGITNGINSKWITEVSGIKTYYSKGIMFYTITDSLLEDGKLTIKVIALKKGEGFMLKLESYNLPKSISLIWTFGGASGKKFSRDGDIGADPESVFYLQPNYCIDNNYYLQKNYFLLEYGSENNKQETGNNRNLIGIFPESQLRLANATNQNSPIELYNSLPDSLVVVSGKIKSIPNTGLFWLIKNDTIINNTSQQKLSEIFDETVIETKKLANRIKLLTPDPYLNTLGSSLSIAADAIWESPAYLHGAVAWRMHLNAWRGAYAADPLGWHDRAKTHFTSYGNSQVTSPLTGPIVFDSNKNLARQKEEIGTSMFSSGYISRHPNKNSVAHHYDMNLVFIDQLLRHFNWTGDISFLNEIWPVLKKHFEWEKRNFDSDNNGLYDAYASIWASDALQYNGGEAIHSSAYNFFANKTAAFFAKKIQKNQLTYQNEATQILKSVNEQLWIPEKGIFAEYKDGLGNKLLHESPGLWSVYHTIDSEISNPFQTYQLLRYVETNIPHIPIVAEGLNKKNLYTISTTNWQPYTWSINNVSLAEQLHTALAFWQGGQSESAFTIWESALIESMYLGPSPGGFEQLLFHDAMRGELYRDFADPVGMAARSLVEGLFGILPNMLNNTLTIKPGFPNHWKNASLEIPDISIDFKRNELIDLYQIESKFPSKMNLKLVVNVNYEDIKSVKINGENVHWEIDSSVIGQPKLIIENYFQSNYIIEIIWDNKKLESLDFENITFENELLNLKTKDAKLLEIYDPQKTIGDSQFGGKSFSGRIIGSSFKTFFIKLQQGKMIWWHPVNLTIKPKVEGKSIRIENDSLLFSLTNNTKTNIEGILTFNQNRLETLQNVSILKEIETIISIPLKNLVSGTNTVNIKTTNNKIHKITFTNWDIPINNKQHLEPISLTRFFNSKVTDIFNYDYLSPRSETVTLQLPKQGIGNWCYPNISVKIDDSGLREKAKNGEQITSPQGIIFNTPSISTKNNIAFTSLWDNFPEYLNIPLEGKASHLFIMVAGSTNPMQSRFVNGEISVEYTDGSIEFLQLKNPENWWPIEQDYYTDGYAFTTDAVKPPRVYLKSGIITRTFNNFTPIKGFSNYGIEGGAATLLDLPLNKEKTLKKLTIKTIANDVVIGLMSATLIR